MLNANTYFENIEEKRKGIVMDLKEILDFTKKNKELLDDLKKTTGDVISDAKALVIDNNKKRAEAFVATLGEKIKVESGEDRLRALNAAILELQRDLLETEDTLREMAINKELAVLLQMRANVQVAAGFNEVVAFSADERDEIAALLKRAEDDIDARKDLKTAIDITISLAAIAAKIAGKAAIFGIL